MDTFHDYLSLKDEQTKIRLLIWKLDTKWHDPYKDYILPEPTSFTKTMKPLNEVIREKQFLFTIRFKCKLTKDDDYVTFAVHVSRQIQKFKLN